ncbi:hypothetical protein ERX46_04930 [Brumimicrobium glaciale]|jgi:hypothetical protein|uniref:Uncharacterized protein n=1 Tax=Brumimicrobium glaciale TaxID=200475 RepID=A0A4Q4KMU2_9FLAO|nr:hypothetical protein [Brumimicrobium glaciale]RYM34721.1 hypothetical protein ERX46_04930 [Brumimicrobium glaciale]
MRNWIVIFLVALLFQGCGISMGDRIDNGNLSVYFLEGINKEKAIEFSKYWRNNGFLGEEKQIIQLEREEKTVVIKLIEREMYHSDSFTINEEAMLQELERALKKEIFHEDVEIMITDNTFRPILKR